MRSAASRREAKKLEMPLDYGRKELLVLIARVVRTALEELHT
jgi:hypothetical protein